VAKRVEICGSPDAIELLRKALGTIPGDLTEMQRSSIDETRYDIEELNARLQRHLAEYLDPENPRTRGSIEWWLKREIRYFERRAYVEGRRAGRNFTSLDEFDEKRLKRLRYEQFRYLRGFLDDIDAHRGVMGYRRRMRMYADATSGVYWLGFVMANRSNRRRITWRTTPAEHCPTCLELDGKSWTPRTFMRWHQRYHILPGVNTQCRSNCKCFLQESFTGGQR